jgi:hypothetical protein
VLPRSHVGPCHARYGQLLAERQAIEQAIGAHMEKDTRAWDLEAALNLAAADLSAPAHVGALLDVPEADAAQVFRRVWRRRWAMWPSSSRS